jgi:hypothetical protein
MEANPKGFWGLFWENLKSLWNFWCLKSKFLTNIPNVVTFRYIPWNLHLKSPNFLDLFDPKMVTFWDLKISMRFWSKIQLDFGTHFLCHKKCVSYFLTSRLSLDWNHPRFQNCQNFWIFDENHRFLRKSGSRGFNFR